MTKQLFGLIKLVILMLVTSTQYRAQLDMITRPMIVSNQAELPLDQVDFMFQNKQNLLIFAGNFGCTSFDGDEFKQYTSKNGLTQTSILNSWKSPNGLIWFLSEAGDLSHFENGKIIRHSELRSWLSKRNEYPFMVYFDQKDQPILIYRNPHFAIHYRYKEKSNRFVIHKQKLTKPGFFLFHQTNISRPWCILTEESDGITNQFHFDFKSERIRDTTVKQKHNELFFNYIQSGSKFIFFIKHDLYVVNEKGLKHLMDLKDTPLNLHLSRQKNQIWISFRKGGVRKLNISTGAWVDQMKFPNELIRNLVEDHEGGLWVLNAQELKHYSPEICKLLLHTTDDHPYTQALVINDTLYLSTADGNIASVRNGQFKAIKWIKEGSPFPSGIKLMRISCMGSGFDKQLRVSMNNGSLLRYQSKTNSFVQLPIQDVSHIHSNANETWYANWTQLIREDKHGIKIIEEIKQKPPIDFQSVLKLENGQMVIGSTDGLWLKQNNSFKRFSKHEITRESVWIMKKLRENLQAVIFSGRGVMLFSPKDTLILETIDGLPSNQIFDILLDSKNRLWIGGHAGISLYQLNPKNLKIRLIQHYNPSSFPDFKVLSLIEWRGKIYGLGSKFFFEITFTPKKKEKPQLIIQDVKLNSDIQSSEHIRFRYGEVNHIEINFNLISFDPGRKAQYHYRLKGLSDHWFTGHENNASFNSLPPGNYLFEVKANWPFEALQSDIRCVPITISPLWYQQLWFKVIAWFVSVGMLVFFFLKWLRRKNKQLKSREQLLRLKQEALNAKLNPHFVFNALNSIQSFIVHNNSEEGAAYLSKFARLIRLVLDSSSKDIVPLYEEIQLVKLYLELEKLRFRERLSFEIHVQPGLDQMQLKVPMFLIQPYIENAIWHGLSSVKTGGLIQVRITSNKGYLLCTITDNGIGRKNAELRKKKSNPLHVSQGMQINKNRLKIISFLYGQEIEVNVKDLMDENLNNNGTEVVVKLKINSSKAATNEHI